jgi:exopolysaccharide production protein ExoQ
MLKRGFLRIIDMLFVFGLLFLANVSALFYPAWLTPEFVFVESILWLLFAAISIWNLKENGLLSKFIESLKINWLIFPFLLFSGLSIFWSVYWEISFSRWLIFLFTIIAGATIGLRYEIKDIFKYLSLFGISVLFASLFFIVFEPRIGVMNYYIIHDAWKGIYWHKGHMGLIAAFINILFLINVVYSVQIKGKYTIVWSFLYLFSLLFVYKTDSAAAYLTIIFLHGMVLLTLVLLKFKDKIKPSHYLIFIFAVIFVGLVILLNLGHVFSLFHRSTSLTGRIPMWTYLFNTYLSQRPMLGYGFNAFWYVGPYRVAMGLAAGYPDPIIISDNGFIDILINTGYAGLILFLLFYSGMWWRSIQKARVANDIIGVFPLVLMTFTLIANISWSLIFENEGFFMLMMISLLFSISSNILSGHKG